MPTKAERTTPLPTALARSVNFFEFSCSISICLCTNADISGDSSVKPSSAEPTIISLPKIFPNLLTIPSRFTPISG